jgi:hypothetical protein
VPATAVTSASRLPASGLASETTGASSSRVAHSQRRREAADEAVDVGRGHFERHPAGGAGGHLRAALRVKRDELAVHL